MGGRGTGIRGLGEFDRRPRGECSVCGRDFLLKTDGTVRHHGGKPTHRVRRIYREYRCPGAGLKPKAA